MYCGFLSNRWSKNASIKVNVVDECYKAGGRQFDMAHGIAEREREGGREGGKGGWTEVETFRTFRVEDKRGLCQPHRPFFRSRGGATATAFAHHPSIAVAAAATAAAYLSR